MLLHLPLLKTALLWLTTAASLFGIAPRFECVCPNGSKQTLLFLANASCCAKRTPAVSEPITVPAEGRCPKCHPPKCDGRTGDAKVNCSDSPCKKSIVVADAVVTLNVLDTIALEFVDLPQLIELPFHVAFSRSLRHSIAADQSLPSPDLVITLRHLVI